ALEEVRIPKVLAAPGPPAVDQLALADLLSTGEYERHVVRARHEYRHRRDRLVRALSTRLPGLEFRGAAAGRQLLLELPEQGDDVGIADAAAYHRTGVRA